MTTGQPQIIKMSLNTYQGSEAWKSLKPMTLTPEQEQRIAEIWKEASKKIKDIVFERNADAK